LIVTGAEKLVEQDYQTLVLFHSLKHGAMLHKLISNRMNCVLLSGKDSQKRRQKAKDDLEAGKINCVIASKVYDIGVDIPSLSGLIVASSGKSSVRALQRIGRVIRRYPGKSQAAVIDFADQAPYLHEHAIARKRVYEEEFEVEWPTPATR
jgi:superfamily II DNA or RNA helicase